MLNRNDISVWCVAVLLAVSFLSAQMSGNNFLEYQLGNLPGQTPGNLSTLYDQLNLSYRYNSFRFNTKMEWFQSDDHNKEYARFVQKSIQYENDGIELTIGNFYYMIGRGLLLRSYEITGAILEDNTFRTRYGFYRDLEGFRGGYENDWLSVTAFRGRPLYNLLPPNQKRKFLRPHLLEGVNTQVIRNDWSVGLTYLRDNFAGQVREFAGAELSVNLPFDIQIYSEYAQDFADEAKMLGLDRQTPHAWYSGVNYFRGSFGLSFEYKDYNRFDLGYNDPPPLVKEHQYILLNRSTHAVETLHETGWQVEGYYTMDAGHGITVNWAEAKNELYGTVHRFSEQFIELNYDWSEYTVLKGFADYSREDIYNIDKRYTFGSYMENEWNWPWGSILNLEYQSFERQLASLQQVENLAGYLTVTNSPDIAVSLVVERSDDPAELSTGKKHDYWMSGNISYQFNQNHLFTLFYGKRRGGRSCTSGICYDILPFEGLEVRVTSNL